MSSLLPTFLRRAAKDQTDTPCMSQAELHELLGRDIVPGRLESMKLAAQNYTDLESQIRLSTHIKQGPRKVGVNSVAGPIIMESSCALDVINALDQPVQCYYDVAESHSTRNHDYKFQLVTPLKLTVGIAAEFKNYQGTGTHIAPLVEVQFDHRDRSQIKIKELKVSMLGLGGPLLITPPRDLAAKALRVIGAWMDRIDKGEILNPHECRAEMKAATNIKDYDISGQPAETTIREELQTAWNAQQSSNASQRLKNMYAKMKRAP